MEQLSTLIRLLVEVEKGEWSFPLLFISPRFLTFARGLWCRALLNLGHENMRRTLPLVIVSITLLSSPAIASWVRVQTNRNNNIYSVDVDSIQGRGRFRYFWSDIVFGKPQSVAGKLASRAIFYLSVDCQKKLFRLQFTRYLDDNNTTIQDYNYGDNTALSKPVPGSSEAASMNFVCSRR